MEMWGFGSIIKIMGKEYRGMGIVLLNKISSLL
jgi:hypothetical protein